MGTVRIMEPLSIKGIDPHHVGTPRNDGTAGSGLYAVPIELNRRATPREATLLQQIWDRPPQFTSMHRTGICRVSGNIVTLDGTTIEEVRAETLRLVVDAVNVHEAEAVRQDEIREKDAADAAQTHEANVADVAKDIKFE